MTPELATALRTLAQGLPPGSAIPVPVETLLQLLDGPVAPALSTPPVDLTVDQVAKRYGRHRSTVRLWLAAGGIPGAYRFQGREWRVPVSSLEAFEARARERGREPSPAPRPAGVTGAPIDLGGWRTARAAGKTPGKTPVKTPVRAS